MCAALIFSWRLSNLCWSYIFILFCSKLWYCQVEFFYLSVLKNYYAYTYSFFDNISHTFKKHPLLGLSSNVVTFDHVFTYILQKSLTVYQFLWLDGQKAVKTDAWVLELCSTNSAGLHFRKVVEKIQESGKKNQKKKTYKMGRKNMAGEKICVRAHLGQNFKNIIISSNLSLNLLWKLI